MTSLHHRYRYVTTVDVGSPSSSYASGESERWQSFKILFHRFADLPSAVGQSTLSPEFTCNGHRWCLRIYPGGFRRAGRVSLHLVHCSKGNVTASYEMSVIKKSQGLLCTQVVNDHNFVSHGERCWTDFSYRSNILDNCLDDNGTLAVLLLFKSDSASPFVPNNPMSGMITDMFLDEETADVCFTVSNEDVLEDAGDEAASSSVTFHAHSQILKACAPILASLFDTDDEKITTATVSITDVEPAIFRHLLHYVYGGIVPDGEMKTHAKDIINAADKYSIVNLKLAAEVAYVESTEITMENAIANLLYADSRNCAFLKEVVVDYLIENSEEATEKLSFADVPGYLMKDLLFVINRRKKHKVEERNRGEIKFTLMGVGELRRKLDEKGLAVDGSREVMVRALEENASKSADAGKDDDSDDSSDE